ncbi:MAG: NAD(P)-binding domain-containing protein, partial [Terriglobia bacterium]
FHYLPERVRLQIVRTSLGPSGGWFIKEKIIGRVPLLLGYNLQRAKVQSDKVHLRFSGASGDAHDVVADRVIAATGYRVNLARLPFLGGDLRSEIATASGAPVLSSTFESSVPGLYFAGISAANSFGPVMRFAFGAGFAARTLAHAIAAACSKETTPALAPGVETIAE